MLLQVLALKRPRDLWYAGDRKELDYLPHLAVDTGVDLQGIEKAVLEEHKQAARAAKEAARAPAGATNEAAPQGSIAREGEAPPAAKKPARRPKAKLTAEEAQQGIAYAMQGEESSQAQERAQEDAAAIAKLRELPHVDDAVAGTLHDAGIEDATDLFDVTSEELSGLTGLEIDQAHALLHAARARILAADAKPAAGGGGDEILAGATVKILETVKDSRRLRWVGKTGAVLGRIGDRGFDVSFASRGGGRVTFDRSEIEQVQA
jgi:hypothetical protein